MLSQADPKGGFRAVRGRSAGVRSTSGVTGHEISSPTDRPPVRHIGGRLASYAPSGRAAVTRGRWRAWPERPPGFDGWRAIEEFGIGHAHAVLRGRSLRSSDPCGKAKRRAGPVRPGFGQRYRTVHRPAGRPTGPPPPRSGAHIAFPRRDRWSGSDPRGRGRGAQTRTAPNPQQSLGLPGRSQPHPNDPCGPGRPGQTRRKTFARYGFRRPAGAHVRSAGVRIGTLCRFRGPVRLYVVLRAVHRGWRMNQLCAAFMISAT